MTIFAPIFNTIDVSKYRCFLFDVSCPSMVATDVNTDIEHRCLCSMSHPYPGINPNLQQFIIYDRIT
jgi:hypothetical protein